MDESLKEQHGILLPLQMAGRTLRLLRRLQLVDNDHEFTRTELALLVPLVRGPSDSEAQLIRELIGDAGTQLAVFAEVKERPRNLEAALRGQIPDELIARLPRSFDVIGDIAVIELPEDMERFSAVIGKGILKINPQIRLALRKSSEIAGTFRTRKYEAIAGVGGTETVYREFSCRYHLDVSTVYFNPRLSHERLRVAQQVKPAEFVVDMFAGVGPYSILIAKHQPESRVYSVDLNPAAVKYLKENALANGVADRVISMLGDAKQFARQELRGLADRVIMNLPSEAKNYIAAASQILKDQGGIIHFYEFARREENLEEIRNSFQFVIEAQNRKIKSFQFCKVTKEVAPNRVELAIDALVK
jgi:tRNA (guanine37-N1)-methyltransferase